MRIGPLEINLRRKALPSAVGTSTVIADRGTWWRVFDWTPGDWQKDIKLSTTELSAHGAVYSCTTLIANDIAKLRAYVAQDQPDGTCIEVKRAPFTALLRRPNHFQTWQQFVDSWLQSKLREGNTYLLKERDFRGNVTALYVLDPCRVVPLVADDASVFYRLDSDNLSGVREQVVVPATEIIHDRMNCLFHPLVGISPLFACGIAAAQGLAIQSNSRAFFTNGSLPRGIIEVPGALDKEKATRLKENWQTNYSGANAGKVAILADNMKYSPLGMSASDSQLIEQLKMTDEQVCACFHVPGYKVGVGQLPANTNIEALNQQYYDQALQIHVEAIETLLEDGLSVPDGFGIELDLTGLLRMDQAQQITALKDAVAGAIMAPNEARRRLNLPPVPGGNAPLAQQQNYSLEALAKRDALADPFAAPTSTKAVLADLLSDDSVRVMLDLLVTEAVEAKGKPQGFRFCGVWNAGHRYQRGDFVARDGSMFHCQADHTTAVPGKSTDWQLAVKRGRDARERNRSVPLIKSEA